MHPAITNTDTTNETMHENASLLHSIIRETKEKEQEKEKEDKLKLKLFHRNSIQIPNKGKISKNGGFGGVTLIP